MPLFFKLSLDIRAILFFSTEKLAASFFLLLLLLLFPFLFFFFDLLFGIARAHVITNFTTRTTRRIRRKNFLDSSTLFCSVRKYFENSDDGSTISRGRNKIKEISRNLLLSRRIFSFAIYSAFLFTAFDAARKRDFRLRPFFAVPSHLPSVL